MTDPNRRLWQLVAKFEASLDGDAETVVKAVQAQLAQEGWQSGGESERIIQEAVDGFESGLRQAVTTATGLGVGEAVEMRDAVVARLAAQAFAERWEDGKTLSDRIWAFQGDAVKRFHGILADGINAGKSASGLVYDMQRAIERNGGPFDLVATNLDDWAAQLTESARALVKSPKGRAEFAKLVRQARVDIERLKANGTRHAALTFVQQLGQAFQKADDALMQEAVRWWWYDKQLYQLKRIARTEIATAQHRAVIDSSRDDPDVIGYQWRLSASHPEPDICDWYASIDMGLGRGVWSKEAVPRHKAHPHCMCTLDPRVTKVKEKGSVSYGEFVRGLPPGQRAALLPKWAAHLAALGTPLESLVRGDGLGLVARQEMAVKMGEAPLKAAEALGRALAESRWPRNTIKPNAKMAGQTLSALRQHSQVPEVGQFLRRLAENAYQVDSREWHYFKYKYQFGDSLKSPADLDGRFAEVLRDGSAKVYHGGVRYIVHSAKAGRIAIVSPAGERVTVYRPDDGFIDTMTGDPWTIHMLKG